MLPGNLLETSTRPTIQMHPRNLLKAFTGPTIQIGSMNLRETSARPTKLGYLKKTLLARTLETFMRSTV